MAKTAAELQLDKARDAIDGVAADPDLSIRDGADVDASVAAKRRARRVDRPVLSNTTANGLPRYGTAVNTSIPANSRRSSQVWPIAASQSSSRSHARRRRRRLRFLL